MTEVVPVVLQLSVAEAPAVMVVGLELKVAVGGPACGPAPQPTANDKSATTSAVRILVKPDMDGDAVSSRLFTQCKKLPVGLALHVNGALKSTKAGG